MLPMPVRACCLPILFLSFTVGCQTVGSTLFPWTDDSSVPSLTEAEFNRSRDEPTGVDDVFKDTVQLASSTAVKFDEVKPELEHPREAKSERVDAWLRRGQDAVRLASANPQSAEILSQATYSFREALRIDPDNADAHHGMAIVSDLNEDWDLADVSYKRALAARPNDVNLLNDQGYSYLLQSRYREASQYLNRALQLSPGHQKSHINLAILDIRLGNQQSALMRLSQVYPAAKAQNALASLMQQHGGDAPAMNQQSPMVAQSNSGAMVVGPGGRRPPVAAVTNSQPQYAMPQFGRTHAGGTNAEDAQQTQPELFSQNGVIQTQRLQGRVQPVAATNEQGPARQFNPTNGIQPVGGSLIQRNQRPSSPLDSARVVGGKFQLPAGKDIMRPQLPAAANVYNPDVRASGGGPQQLTQPATPGAMNRFPTSANSQFPMYPASNAATPGTPALNPAPNYITQTGVQTPFPQLQQGMTPSYNTPQMQNQLPGQPPLLQGAVGPGGVMRPPAVYQAPVSPTAWSPSAAGANPHPTIPGQFTQGIPGIPQPGISSPQVAAPVPLAPQYFSPPPLMGNGYQAGAANTPDPLAEYRAAQQQLKNEYNQTLQQIGGSSFQ
jgi:tetratricopeptide (TPR) repeat protein